MEGTWDIRERNELKFELRSVEKLLGVKKELFQELYLLLDNNDTTNVTTYLKILDELIKIAIQKLKKNLKSSNQKLIHTYDLTLFVFNFGYHHSSHTVLDHVLTKYLPKQLILCETILNRELVPELFFRCLAVTLFNRSSSTMPRYVNHLVSITKSFNESLLDLLLKKFSKFSSFRLRDETLSFIDLMLRSTNVGESFRINRKQEFYKLCAVELEENYTKVTLLETTGKEEMIDQVHAIHKIIIKCFIIIQNRRNDEKNKFSLFQIVIKYITTIKDERIKYWAYRTMVLLIGKKYTNHYTLDAYDEFQKYSGGIRNIVFWYLKSFHLQPDTNEIKCFNIFDYFEKNDSRIQNILKEMVISILINTVKKYPSPSLREYLNHRSTKYAKSQNHLLQNLKTIPNVFLFLRYLVEENIAKVGGNFPTTEMLFHKLVIYNRSACNEIARPKHGIVQGFLKAVENLCFNIPSHRRSKRSRGLRCLKKLLYENSYNPALARNCPLSFNSDMVGHYLFYTPELADKSKNAERQFIFAMATGMKYKRYLLPEFLQLGRRIAVLLVLASPNVVPRLCPQHKSFVVADVFRVILMPMLGTKF